MDSTILKIVRERTRSHRDLFHSRSLLEYLVGPEPDEQQLVAVAGNSAYSARGTFTRWTYSESDKIARLAFATAADRRQAHLERVGSRLPSSMTYRDGGRMHDFVRAQEETTARLATGFVGRGLIASHAYERIKAFFAESNRSDLESLFTELAADERETVETGIDLLEERDFEEGRREEVVSLAVRTVDIAASELTESIE